MKRFFWILSLVCLIVLKIGVSWKYNLYNNKYSSDNKMRVAAIMDDEENPFWKDVWYGVREGCISSGLSLSEYQFSDLEEEKQYLEICSLADISGLILYPAQNSDEELYQMLEQAKKEGIHTVVLDTEIPEESCDAFIGMDNIEAGTSAARLVSKNFEKESTILLVSYDKPPSKAIAERMTSFCKEIESLGLSSNLITITTTSDEIESIQNIQTALEKIKGNGYLIACGSKTTLRAAGTVARLSLSEQIQVIGFDSTEDSFAYVNSGVIDALFVQDSRKLGDTAIEVLDQILNGGDSPFIRKETSFSIVTAENIDELKKVR